MKRSIRYRLFASISLLIGFFVLCAWMLNTFYLGSFYRAQKTTFLMNTATEINQLYKGSSEDINQELESLERNSGVNILIEDGSLSIKYATTPRFQQGPRRKADVLLILSPQQASALQQNGSFLITTRDAFLDTDFLNLVFVLNNQDYLILSTPLLAIQQNAAIANQFFLYTGLLTLIIGLLLAFLFSRSFTRPILELNDITQRMTSLDFSKKYQGKNADEIGDLGQNINSLSDQLYKSITELQEANQVLKEDIEKERRIDEMRKEFVSSVSHELKTPIALIQGYAEGLKVNIMEDEENKNFYCDVIMDEAGKMNKLVRDLLDLSHIESGQFRLEKDVFDLSALIDRIMAKFDPVFKQKDVHLEVEKDNRLLVYADRIRSEQVLVNYLNNAVNHLDEARLLKITVTRCTQKAHISVFNSGNPIPEDALDKLFTSFYKVDKARTRSYGGTGLGLSVVRAIQELDGNALGVFNRENGVEFWFELDQMQELPSDETDD
ncbi:MAG TPA: HAMP domain-containing sensor histidine kinase [Syntrophomonadaceae bacterium]|nr:HAMP domain-containing sensor histidine kinase [Syntrophomonadaceae bacterium]